MLYDFSMFLPPTRLDLGNETNERHRENFGFQNSKRNVYCITCLLYKPFDRPDDWLYKTALPDGRSKLPFSVRSPDLLLLPQDGTPGQQ